ncbi:MAG: LEPR-XLL domain-containing protein [Planctomycetes bacterium]|nr:LEPR-XLL domain-containing protein [Planctomycetota bacterium]
MNSKDLHAKALHENPHNGPAGMFESLEPRLMLAAAPVFETDLAAYYALNSDGKGLTIGVDGFDADGDGLTLTVTASDPTGLRWEIFDGSTSTNRYAVMHYTQSDGTPLGDIVVQLFEDRAPLATERFITLATHDVDAQGNLIPAGGGVDPWYTDVVVHRVIDGFMFQSGDAANGDGTGETPLGVFPTETHDDLSFMGRGLLATANRGGDTNDGQWFITDGITTWLDGNHTIFGQVVSGWDVYETIITRPTGDNDRPLDPPLLAGVDIVDSPADATVTFVADETFTGPVDLTITLSDTEGNDVWQTVTLLPEPVLQDMAGVHGQADQGVTVTMDLAFADTALPLTFETVHSYEGPGEILLEVVGDVQPGQYTLQIGLPPEYDNSTFGVAVYAYMDQFDNLLYPANRLAGPLPSNAVVFVHGLPTVGAIDDVAAEPGGALETSFTIAYDGPSDLNVALATAGYPGGELDLAGALIEPAQAGDPYTIRFDLPAGWDGTPFDVEVSVELADHAAPPSVGTFQVAMAMPSFDLPDDVHVVPGEHVELTIPASYDGPAAWTATAASDYANGGVLDLAGALTPPAQEGDPFTLAFDVPAEYDGGAFTITLTSTLDGYAAPPAAQTFGVVRNAAPVFPSVEGMLLAGGATGTQLVLIEDDGDADDLVVAVSTAQAGATVAIDPQSRVVTITAPAAYSEPFAVTVTAIESRYDGTGLEAPATATIWVAPALPSIEPLDDLAVVAGETLAIASVIDDAGGQPLDVAVSTVGYPGGELDLGGAVTPPAQPGDPYLIEFDVPADWDGTAFQVRVSAALAGVTGFDPAVATFDVTLNAAPQIAPLDELFVAAGQSGQIQAAVTDADGHDVTVWVETAQAGATVSIDPDTHLVTVTAPADFTGWFDVTISAIETHYDGKGLVEPTTRTFTVVSNRRPEIAEDRVIRLDVDQTILLPLTISDPEGQTADFTTAVIATSHPEAVVEIDPATHALTITPPPGFAGVFSFTVSVIETEYVGQFNPAEVTFYVTTLSDALAIDPVADQTVSQAADGVPFSIRFHGSQEVQIELSDDYDGPGDVGLSYVPPAQAGDPYELAVTLPDGYDRRAFNVTIRATVAGFEQAVGAVETTFAVKADEAPAITPVGLVEMAPGGSRTTAVVVRDADTPYSELSVAFDATEDGAAITFADGRVTVVAPAGFTGVFGVTMTVVEERYDGVAGVDPVTDFFVVSTLNGQPSIDPVDDVTVDPLEQSDPSIPFTVRFDHDLDITVTAATDYDGPGAIGTTIDGPDGGGGGAYTLNLDIPPAYDGSAFTVTLTAAVAGYPDLARHTASFTVTGNARPALTNDPLVIARRMNGQTLPTVVKLAATDGDGPEGDIVLGIEGLPAGWTWAINEHDEATITPPADFTGVQAFTVTALEAAYAGKTDAGRTTFYFSALDGPRFGQMDVDDRDATYPGDAVSIPIPITYAGTPALLVEAASDYDNGGTLDLTDAIVPGNPGQLQFTLPAEYDGGTFTVTVTATVEGYGEAVEPISATFTFSAGSRPTLEDPGIESVIAGQDEWTEIRIPVADADDEDGPLGPFVYALVGVEDPNNTGATVEVEPYDPSDPRAMVVKIQAPADASGTLTVTVSAIEEGLAADHPQLATERTFTVVVVDEDAVPVISEIDRLDLAAGQFEDVTFTVDYSGPGELTLDVEHDYERGTGQDVALGALSHSAQDGTWTFRVTLPSDYKGMPFTVTITPSIDGTPLAAAARSFEVAYGVRPEITHLGDVEVPDLDETPLTVTAGAAQTITLPLAIIDADQDDLDLEDLVVQAWTTDQRLEASVAFNEQSGQYELTLTLAKDAAGPIGVSVGVVEAEHEDEDIVWGGIGFWVQVVSVSGLEDVAVMPGSTIDVPFQVGYDGDGVLAVTASSTHADVAVAVTPPDPEDEDGSYTLRITVAADYDGSAFDVTIAANVATVNDLPLAAPATATLTASAGLRPQIVDPGPQVLGEGENLIPLTIIDADGAALTLTAAVQGAAGVTAAIDPGTHVLTVTVPAGTNSPFEVIVTAIETAYAGKLTATERTIPMATGLYLLSQLPDTVVLPADGRGLTIALDGWAPGGLPIAYTAASSSKQVSAYLPPANTNRYAELTFADEDGQIGTILVELFDDRYAGLAADVESPVDRFVTLATRAVRQIGYDLDADKPIVEHPAGDPFYTDVDVHRIIPGFMFQTGDAREGNGTGGTGMGPIADNFGPAAYKPGNLSFAGRGMLAFANNGPGTSDGQFFITEVPTPHLDGLHPIFGQIVSGWDVYDAVLYRPTGANNAPQSMPTLTGVTIVEPGQNTQDAALTLTAGPKFRGSATVTVTMAAEGLTDVVKQITVLSPDQAVAPTFGEIHQIAPAPGGTVTLPLAVSSGTFYSQTFTVTAGGYDGAGTIAASVIGSQSNGYELKLELPEGYDNSDFTVTVVARKISAITGAPILGVEPSTATVEFHAADGEAFIFAENGAGGPVIDVPRGMAVDGEPGRTYSRAFALQGATDGLVVEHDYVGSGRVQVEALPDGGGGRYVLSVALPADYDGSAFTIHLRCGLDTGLAPAEMVVPVRFASRPAIEDPGLITVPPGGDARVPLDIDADADTAITVAAEVIGAAGATAEIVEAFDPDTGKMTYELVVHMPTEGQDEYEGIVKIKVTAVETQRKADHPSLKPFERIVYVSTLRERPEITGLPGDLTQLEGAAGTLELTIDDDSTLPAGMTYEIASSTPHVVAEQVVGAGPQAPGAAETPRFSITAPAGYSGVFTLTVTAVENHPLSDDALTPATYVLTVVVPPGGGEPTITTQSRLDLAAAGEQVTAVVAEGDRMYVGAGSAGLYVYDTSDADDPVLIDAYGTADGFSGSVAGLEVVHRLVDGQTRTVVLLAAGTGGLHSVVLDNGGNVVASDSVATIARDVAVKGAAAYVAAGPAGLVAYDFSDPIALARLGSFTAFVPTLATQRKYQNFRQHPAMWTYWFSDAVAVEIQGNYAFVVDRTGQAVTGYDFRGQTVAINPPTEGWVGVIDIANPAAMKRGTMIMTMAELTDLDLRGNHLFVACLEGLGVYNVGNALMPKLLGALYTDEPIASVQVAHNTALATTPEGYRLIDVSNPRRPVDGGLFRVDTATWSANAGAALDGTTIHVPLSAEGVLSLDGSGIAQDEDGFQNVRSARVWLGDVAVTIRLQGAGTFSLDLDGFNPVINELAVTGADASTRLTISTHPRQTAVIRTITVDGPMNALVGRTTTLTGNLTIDGSVGTLVLGNVGEEGRPEERTLTLGAPGPGDPLEATIVLGEVHNASLISGTALRSLSAIRWMDDETVAADRITAPLIGKLVISGRGKAVAGDFQADLLLDNGGVPAPGTAVLGPTVIRGDVADSLWQVNGDVSKIAVGGALRDGRVLAVGNVGPVVLGGMIRSDLYAGYGSALAAPDTVTGLPTEQEIADSFDALASIGALSLRGLRDGRRFTDSFVDSNVAAGAIGNVSLVYGELDNGDDPFGLAARTVRRLVYRDANRRVRWTGGDLGDLGDLIVRIV